MDLSLEAPGRSAHLSGRAPAVDPQKDRQTVVTPQVELTVVAASNQKEAGAVDLKLVDAGIEAIELYGGFGNKRTARIVDAVTGKAAVGVVRFDGHPGLGGKSGDELF
ncbi:MAG: DUF6506 family protein [Desulfobacterales bacterium]|jgi:hypothetical protein